MGELQQCNRCHHKKLPDDFGYYEGRSGPVLRKMCKSCRGKCEAYNYRNRPGVAERMKKRARVAHLKNQYAISVDEYDRLLMEQRGVCAICGHAPNEKKLNVDHSHTTGRVRGLLCWNCNVGLGYFKDSEQFLINATNYLQRAST